MAEQSLILTPGEETALSDLELIIERGRQTFIDVGTALSEIRDRKLYRSGYWTFEEYCQQRWGFEREYAWRLIGSAQVVNNLLPTGNVVPTNERQTRPLVALKPAKQLEAWQRAVETAPGGRITAAHVASVVQELKQPAMPVHFSSETPEHYTPKEIIDAALECMGFIDLDPCSNSHESPNVPALRHYTVEDDGLSQKWQGFVYMNPPYGRKIGDWVDKLCLEHKAGLVPEAIALLPARPDTQWWKRLRDYPVCFVEGRLTFIGNDGPAPFPSAVFGLGMEIDRFFYAFAHLGDIWQRTEIGMFGQ